jgi:mannose-6-phosphate isomerase-like protein (cupin superfamily)
MQHLNTNKHRGFFKLLTKTTSVQSAMMALSPGQSSSDEPENEHPKSEQWLFVITGTGRARVAGRTVQLKTGSLLLVEKGEPHQITNTGKTPMKTINFYSPPAYDAGGNVKPSIER